MKSIKLLFQVLLLTLFAQNITAQNKKQVEPYNRGLWLSLRGGYDLPLYDNTTPFIDYLGGSEFGTSADYYFNWLGLGMDFDFIENAPLSNYSTNNLTYLGSAINTTDLTEESIVRAFWGLGPSFRYEPSNKFTAELKLRIGIGYVSGGRTEQVGNDGSQPYRLNFHAGYDPQLPLSAKAQLQFNYFFNNWFGLHAGAYSMGHIGVSESYDSNYGMSSGYIPFEPQFSPKEMVMYDSDDHNVFSLGAFVGITIRFPQYEPREPSSLTVTARDSFTRELLPDTDISLKNFSRTVVKTGKTDQYGEVTFNDLPPDNYAIEGYLDGTKLTRKNVFVEEFLPGKNLKKEILYSNLNFIIKVKTVLCNSTTPLSNVLVVLKNTQRAETVKHRTDASGEVTFHIDQKAIYSLNGKKDNYLNTIDTISTNEYDRSKTLFVRLGLCMKKIDCDTSITLDNILYDINDHALKGASKTVLNTLLQFMVDYPTLIVEITSHTDSNGSEDFNQILSDNRANTVKEYLMSHGISDKRLIVNGRGEKDLFIKCAPCTPEQDQLNRRTVMKVICLDKK